MALEPLDIDLPAVDETPVMPAGFRAGAVAAGIKASGGLDLGVLATTGGPASVAATFTSNLVRAAPVELSRSNLAARDSAGGGRWGRATAVLSTSGCANAATGIDGDRDQKDLADWLSRALHVEPEQTLAISTGLIGTRLPVDALLEPLGRLAGGQLASSDGALSSLARQMMTTDSRPKWATVGVPSVASDGTPASVRVSGIAKGVGMIHPRMATMLALILTDADVEPFVLHGLLLAAVEQTWNQLTVDGDTSTNDTVFLLASGAAGAIRVEPDTSAADALGRAIHAVARSLARQQAADGEGATTLITCQVSGASDDRQARAVARSVVASSLVKAAVHGRDPNWGRVAAAAGNAYIDGVPVDLDEERLRIGLCGVLVFAGEPVDFDRNDVARRMDAPEVVVRLDLGIGDGRGEAYGCDLTEQYVVENSAYST